MCETKTTCMKVQVESSSNSNRDTIQDSVVIELSIRNNDDEESLSASQQPNTHEAQGSTATLGKNPVENDYEPQQYQWISSVNLSSDLASDQAHADSLEMHTVQQVNRLGAMSDSSSDTGSSSHCRICWGGAKKEKLVRPCHCASSVHLSCIRKWLQISNKFNCEVCTFPYSTKRIIKPLKEWTMKSSAKNTLNPLEVTLILLTLIVIPIVLGTVITTQDLKQYSEHKNPWKAAGFVILFVTCGATYLLAIIYSCLKCRQQLCGWLDANSENIVVLGGHQVSLNSLKQSDCPDFSLGLETVDSDNNSVWSLS